MKRTDLEITELKNSWKFDGCWDIEDTDGFEDHYDELRAWRLEYEREWKERQQKALEDRAKEANCSIETMRVIQGLESQIQQLQKQIDAMREVQR